MRKRLGSFLLLLVVGSMLAGLWVLTVATYTKQANALEWLGLVFSAIIPTIVFVYNLVQKNSLALFVFTNRVQSMFSSTILTWVVTATWADDRITPQTVLEVVSLLVEQSSKGKAEVQVTNVGTSHKILEISRGPRVEVIYRPPQPSVLVGDDSSSAPSLQVRIGNYRIGYRQVPHVIKHEIVPVLDAVTHMIHAKDERYSFVIEFDKEQNPFLGLYLANLPPETISRFVIQLTVRAYGQINTVQVSESRISINTHTQNALQQLALEFLTFDSNLREHLKSA